MTEQPAMHHVRTAIGRACQAPSLHNSQPWRWVAEGRRIKLYHDGDRMLPFTDAHGRQMLISCGAVLNHAQIAFAAQGWLTSVDRMPDTHRVNHLATLEVIGRFNPEPRDLALADAMDTRRSDRLPFAGPPDIEALEAELRSTAAQFDVAFDVVAPPHRDALERASEAAAMRRSHDQRYQDELRWWTGHSTMLEGVPREALVSGAERGRVAVGRKFPLSNHESRRSEVPKDRAWVVMLSTARDSAPEWIRAGEALSAALLTCTARGLATCPLTHVTEVPASRAILAELGSAVQPQVLVRIGVTGEQGGRRVTRRRPVKDVLRFQE